MRTNRQFVYIPAAIFLALALAGCHPRMDAMATAEKVFIKKIDKAAGKLELNADQMAKLEQLKLDVRKNFQEGQAEHKEAMAKIREEGMKENPDIQKMTSLLQQSLRAETERINKAFDLMLDYQKNLNENKKKKLGQIISEKIRKWD